MRAFEGPDVLARQRDARRRKHVLRWGTLAFYAFLWILIIVGGLMVTNTASENGPRISSLSISTGILIVLLPTLIWLAMIFLTYALAGRKLLKGMYTLSEDKARDGATARRLRSALEELSLATGEPPLQCMVMESSMPNALAVIIKGKTYLVVTSGLLEEEFTQRELTAMVAHEATHIATGEALSWRSSWRLFMTALFLSIITLDINFITNLLTSRSLVGGTNPFVMILIVVLAALPVGAVVYLSKRYEQQDDLFADAMAVHLTRDPEALISCIEKVAAAGGNINYSSFGVGVIAPYAQKSPAALPISASRYFFVNPFHWDKDKHKDQEKRVASYLPLSEDQLLPAFYRSQTRKLLAKHRSEESVFLTERLLAIRRMRPSRIFGSSGEVPADQRI